MNDFLKAYEKLLSLTNLQLKLYTDSPQELKKSMQRMEKFLVQLGSPHEKVEFIHVAGTSGKGSVTNAIHQLLQADGQEVGSYTSPHMTSYLERFRLNDELMKPATLARHLETMLGEYEKFLADHGPMSFFELSTCLAIYAFQKAGVDWCVLETGLGGKWDATNIIPRPVVAVITNIDKDHTDVLGDSLSAIAKEKAGIMKKGCIVLCGETRPKLRKIFKEQAIQTQAALFFVPPPSKNPVNKDIGAAQQHNLALAAKAALEVGVDQKVINRTLPEIKPLPCRFETIQKDPMIIIDGAHAPAKIKAVVELIKKLDRPVRVLFASVANKDYESMLKILSPAVKSITTTRFQTTFRKTANPAELLQTIPKRKQAGYFLDPIAAFKHIQSLRKKDEVILVTGSLFLAGEIRALWISEEDILKNRSSFKK